MRLKGAASALAAALAAALALGSVAGCGRKAPPFLPVPVAGRELKIERVHVGDGVVRLDFSVPRERFSIREEEEPWRYARLLRRREDAPGGEFEERAVLEQEGGLAFGRRQSLADTATREQVAYIYIVELRKEKSKDWAATAPVTVPTTGLPPIPGEIQAEGREGSIALSWEPAPGRPEGGYVVLRRGAGESEVLDITPQIITAPRYVDAELPREGEFCYRVRPVLAQGLVLAEGPLSGEVCAAAVDRTPPPPPERLLAVPVEGGIKISWVPVAADDLRGYHLYRSRGGGPFAKINEAALASTSFVDREVEPGEVYLYRVTAVDNSSVSNESPFSATVEAVLPAR